jgi:maltooligosyltrehalose trehalohydrolase
VYAGEFSAYRDRHHGRPPTGIGGERFVISVQNHDQIGNRATGDRLGHQVPAGRLRIAAALLLTSPFTPLLFQGEEWNATSPFRYFTDHVDAGIGRAVSEGRRRELASFGWDPSGVPDPQDPATFDASVLRWDEVDRPGHRELLDWYRALLRFRRARPELTDGRWPDQQVDHGVTGMLTVRRGRVLVAVNIGPAAADLVVGAAAGPAVVGRVTLLAGAELSSGTLRLDPDGVAVLVDSRRSPPVPARR